MGSRIISKAIDLTNRDPDADRLYITEITANNGIRIHPASTENNSIVINSTGVELFKGGTTSPYSIAKYGDTTRIGKEESSRFLINSTSLQAYNNIDDTPYFEVNSNGLTWGSNTAATTTQVNVAAQTATNYIKVSGNGIKIQNSNDNTDYLFIDSSEISIYRNNSKKMYLTDTLLHLGDSSNYIQIDSNGLNIINSGNNIASYGSNITIGQNLNPQIYISSTGTDAGIKFISQYKNTSNVLQNFYLGDIGFNTNSGWTNNPSVDKGYFPVGAWATMGLRTINSFKGYYSFVTGFNCSATHNASYSGGIMCNAYGPISLAYGMNCRTGYAGNTSTNSGTEGNNGWAAIALGSNLIAQHDVECVVGAYNATGTKEYVFIVGNGYSSLRKNAFTVDWAGNIGVNGTTVHSSDRRLKDHQSYLSTEAIEFIRSLKPVYFKKDQQPHVGFYAQDVEAVDPWRCMVGEMNDFKTLGYEEIIAPLVKYCQYLEQRINKLESKIKEN